MKIALVGATGVVGEQILEQLTKRSFPVGELRLFASAESDGDFVDFAGEPLLVAVLSPEAFRGIDLAIFATPAEVSCDWSLVATAAGAISIDLSAAGRLDPATNLLVAGVNDRQVSGAKISTPASLTVQLALLLNSLRQVATLKSVLVTAVSPASGQGRKGLAELQKQAGELLNGRPVVSQVFPAQLAFNCLPSAGSEQEEALATELRKVLELEGLEIQINRLQLPLFYGEGAFVRVEFDAVVALERIQSDLGEAEAFALQEGAELPTLIDAVGEEELLVQLCGSTSESSATLDLWCAADNLGRCAAGNVVRIAELLAKHIG